MWRWSYSSKPPLILEKVFSTYVEVILWWNMGSGDFISILHVCGGDPVARHVSVPDLKYSPRMWRWSSANSMVISFSIGILHVCGGDPKRSLTFLYNVKYSPRMWRWSLNRQGVPSKHFVFSTYVEVILTCSWCWWRYWCILHVCGGDPFISWLI